MSAKIYALVEPKEDTIRYVGMTIVSLRVRMFGHMNSPGSDDMRLWTRRLRKRGQLPRIVLLDPRGTAAKERRWIKFIGACGHPLLNYIHHRPPRERLNWPAGLLQSRGTWQKVERSARADLARITRP